ncbi:glycosyltransferase family 2 protein [Flavobacterium sp. RSSB_23]|uniref:glycosyltransferase family 2 protein n=1 Tax=Flavobacterium sp. RSSB_23 TaxID=3447668 RepID=UPI003F39C0BD
MSKVSIIIPSYNHALFLQDRLDSILNQTFKNWEAIIIDDQSSDNSVLVIKDFLKVNSDFRVKYFIVNDKNSGSGYNSWKKGIELAETEYVWIAETDDYSEPTFLQELVEILDHNEDVALAFCGSNYIEDSKIIYDSTNRTKDLEVDFGKYKIVGDNVFLSKMPFNTYITNGSSVVFRKPKEKMNVELFNNRQLSDLFLWSFLVQNRKFVFLNKNLNFFRRHENSTTTKMSISSKKIVYEEALKYLNFFEQNYKFQFFLDHYVKHFVWSNKKEVFNYKFLKKIKGIDKIDIKYFQSIIKFIQLKIKSKWN